MPNLNVNYLEIRFDWENKKKRISKITPQKKEQPSLLKVRRYFAVIKPMKIAGIDRRGRTMLIIAWCCSLIFSIPQSFIFHVEHHPNITDYVQCVAFNSFPNEFYHMLYTILGGSLMYALPLLIIIFCYASIYVELYHRSKTCMQGEWLIKKKLQM